jgi:hypothetical protein
LNIAVAVMTARYPEDVDASRESFLGNVDAGLCANCVNVRLVSSDRGSTFIFCGLSRSDPRFPKYPRLPVISCAGYRVSDGAAHDPGDQHK